MRSGAGREHAARQGLLDARRDSAAGRQRCVPGASVVPGGILVPGGTVVPGARVAGTALGGVCDPVCACMGELLTALLREGRQLQKSCAYGRDCLWLETSPCHTWRSLVPCTTRQRAAGSAWGGTRRAGVST